MSTSFEIALAGRFAFGQGRLARLGEELAGLVVGGARVMVVSDRGLAGGGVLDQAVSAAVRAGFSVSSYAELAGEPTAADVDRLAGTARRCSAVAIVAVGGGSVLDAGKLAACVASAQRPAADYALMANPLPARKLALVLAPTTAGTGPEATRTAVYAMPDGRKVWAWGDALRADLALLDPALTCGLPRSFTVATGVDALVHAIEAATARRATPISTAYALEAIRLIAGSLPRAAEAPDDLDARGDMLIAASLAGLAIDQAGTGVAHAIGHALGTIGKVHHGRAVGHCLHAALAWNAETAVVAHAAVARALGAIDHGSGDAALAARCAPAYAMLLEQVGLPLSLADHGLGAADVERLTAAALAEENAPMRDNNARSLSPSDIERFARIVLAA